MNTFENKEDFDLYTVVMNGTPKQLKELLSTGTDPNKVYPLARVITTMELFLEYLPVETVLLKCIQAFEKVTDKKNYLKNLHLLLQYGAHQDGKFKIDENIKNNFSHMLDDSYSFRENFIHMLDDSCSSSDKVKITELLLIYGSKIQNLNAYSMMPLCSAVQNNSYDNAEFLVKWPLRLAAAKEKNSLLAQLYVLSTSAEQEEVYALLCILKTKKVKCAKPIIVLILEYIMNDSARRISGDLVQKIWQSKKPIETAKELVKNMILHKTHNRSALELASKSKNLTKKQEEEERITIKNLLEQYC